MLRSLVICLSLCLSLPLIYAQDSISITGSTFPSTIPSTGQTSVSIKYTASQADTIVVDILSPAPAYTWYGKGTAAVTAGSGNAPIMITIQNTPPAGTYMFNVFIVKTSDFTADPNNAYLKAFAAPQSQTVTVGTSTTTTTTTTTTTSGTYDYGAVASMSILFYEAQRSGRLVNNRIAFRGDSALGDKGINNEDLTGGYYDAGDHVKFNFPAAYAITTLAWGAIAYKQGYVNLNEYQHVMDAIKWGTDYFLKCHPDVNSHSLVAQVGDGNIDHAYWGRPEQMNVARPVSYINDNAPGSDLAGEVAAAFAASAIVFKDTNPTYAATLIAHARTLYTFATTKLGKYSDSIPSTQQAAPGPFYVSSDYKDELVWAAIWLYKATGEAQFLADAKSNYVAFNMQYQTFAFSWDSKGPGVSILMAQLLANTPTDPVYLQAIASVKTFVKSYSVGGSVPRTPGGLPVVLMWGSNRFATAAAWIALVWADSGLASQADATAAVSMAKGILGYVLGDSGRSYVVGFGVNPPTHCHHRAASCPNLPAACGQAQFTSTAGNPQILKGALVGGPKSATADSTYNDARDDFTSNEVTLDYNAAFQNALVRMSMMTPTTGQTQTTTPTTATTNTQTNAPTTATTNTQTTTRPTTATTNTQTTAPTTASTTTQTTTTPTTAPTTATTNTQTTPTTSNVQTTTTTQPTTATINTQTIAPTSTPVDAAGTLGLPNEAHVVSSSMMIMGVIVMLLMMMH